MLPGDAWESCAGAVARWPSISPVNAGKAVVLAPHAAGRWQPITKGILAPADEVVQHSNWLVMLPHIAAGCGIEFVVAALAL
jgi:hypothetical protein